MTYREFQEHRAALLRSRPELVDLCETNPWRAMASLTPRIPERDETVTIHRRELAEAWTRVFGLPRDAMPRAMVSSGVRHSLSLIFPALATRSARLLVPNDVYPMYGELARGAGLATETFQTIPELRIPDRGDWLLLPNPLKPAGRWLSAGDASQIKDWLERRPERRLLLDTVYSFERWLHPTTQALLETGRTVLLHSLSKGWLHQQVFGVALLPECEQQSLAPLFRDALTDPAHLHAARHLLTACSDYPDVVGMEIRRRRARMMNSLPSALLSQMTFPSPADIAGYLIAVNLDSEELLKNHRILTAPLSIFGSPRSDYSVISVLGFA